jgi:hypothetical protein
VQAFVQLASNSTVRIATFSSQPATGDAKPTVPQYTPRRCGSQPRNSRRARSFGVPVTDAGGNVASSKAAIGTSTPTRADTVDTRCHTPGAGRTTSSSGTVTVPVIATRLRSLRTRSTIMMFSATSLTDARSAAGSARRGRAPLIGLDVTVSPDPPRSPPDTRARPGDAPRGRRRPA